MSMVSCTKERGGIYQGGVNGGASGKKLVKVAWLDYEENYGSSTYTHSNYEWERFVWSGNQLTDIMDGEYENGGPVEESYGGQFIYDGANLTEIREQNGDYQRNVYFTYNNGHITEIYRATVNGSYSSWYRENMTYSSDGHLQEVTGINSYGNNYRYSLTWSGDNVISEQYFSNGSLLSTTNYTYDNKKSAYTEMPEWYIIYVEAYSMLSANNVLMANDFYNGGSYNYSYTYTYDGEWPVKRILYEDNEKYTTFYEYSDGTGKSQMPQIYAINATENNSSWGDVYGSGEYAAGSTVILNAQAFSGYTFQQWSDGNTQNPRTFTANGNATYTAIFGTSGGGGGNNATASVSFNGTTWSASSIYAYISTSNNIFLVSLFKNDNQYPFAEVYYSAESGTITTGTKTGTSNVDISAQTAAPGNPFMWYYTSAENGMSLGDEPCGDWWNRTMTLNITKFDLANMKLSFTATATMGNLMECVDGTVSNWSQTSSCYMSVTATDLPMTYSSKSAPATRVNTQSHISKAGKATNRLADRLADGRRRHRIK